MQKQAIYPATAQRTARGWLITVHDHESWTVLADSLSDVDEVVNRGLAKRGKRRSRVLPALVDLYWFH